MRIVFIETGRPPEPISSKFGDYPQMMVDFLSPYLEGGQFETCSLINGARLPKLDDIDGIFIMGSPHSVYDDLPWINPLIAFINQVAAHKIPQIGICFGHQMIAKALGGLVEKAPNGWGIGRHTYSATSFNMGASGGQLNLLVSHQDQVIIKPKGAQVLAQSDFTPNAMLYYKDSNALSIQAHPEFKPEFLRELIEARRGARFSIEEADKALSSIIEPIDGHIVARLFTNFILANKAKLAFNPMAA